MHRIEFCTFSNDGNYKKIKNVENIESYFICKIINLGDSLIMFKLCAIGKEFHDAKNFFLNSNCINSHRD